MRITLERSIASDAVAEHYPFTLRVEIINATKDRGAVYEVPVYVRYNGLNKTFGVEVFGFREEVPKPHLLVERVEKLLRGLITAVRFPTYMFIARRAKAIFPVYTIDHEVFATTQHGPVFRHVELAKVREYLTDYLHEANILGTRGLSDKLYVRGVSTHTLGLRRPVLYLKKRVLGENDFWAPVFQSGNGRSLYTYAASQRHEIERQSDEVLLLLRTVASALQTDGRLNNPLDLRPDRLMPSYWRRLEQILHPVGVTTVGDHRLGLYEINRCLIAVEERTDEERFGLFLGETKEDVQQRVRADYERRGLI